MDSNRMENVDNKVYDLFQNAYEQLKEAKVSFDENIISQIEKAKEKMFGEYKKKKS